MRTLALSLLLIPALVLAQAPAAPPSPPPAKKPATSPQVYKWVDDKGVVHYTDKPPAPGAEPAKLPPLQTYKGGTRPSLSKFDKPGTAGKEAPASVEVKIVTPSSEETFRSAERVVPVAVVVTPQLKPNWRLIYLYDGTPQAQPVADTSYALTGVERGTHTVSVTAVDETGQEIGSSSPVTFYMKPPTVPPPDNSNSNSQNPNKPATANRNKPTPPTKKP